MAKGDSKVSVSDSVVTTSPTPGPRAHPGSSVSDGWGAGPFSVGDKVEKYRRRPPYTEHEILKGADHDPEGTVRLSGICGPVDIANVRKV